MSDSLYAALARPLGAGPEAIDGHLLPLDPGAVPSLYADISRPAEGVDGAFTAVTRQTAETVDNDLDPAGLLDRWGGRTWTTRPASDQAGRES